MLAEEFCDLVFGGLGRFLGEDGFEVTVDLLGKVGDKLGEEGTDGLGGIRKVCHHRPNPIHHRCMMNVFYTANSAETQSIDIHF